MSKGGKVNIEKLHSEPLFGNVTCGQFFEYGGDLCVRTSKAGSGEWEAFSFITNEKFHIPHTDRVDLADCELRYSLCLSEV